MREDGSHVQLLIIKRISRVQTVLDRDRYSNVAILLIPFSSQGKLKYQILILNLQRFRRKKLT